MLWTLIHKEALAHLLSARFQLTVALVITLMVTGGVLFQGDFSRRIDDFHAAEASRIANLAEYAERSNALFQVYSYYDQQIMARPSELGFVADGHESKLPNVIKLNAFRIHTPTTRQRGNPMLPYFHAIDWALVVTVVLSFAAIVLTFDGFAGEKERGTLRLLLANPVPRWQLVAAKLIGAWAVLMLAFVIGLILQLLILLQGGWLVLDGGLALRLVAALVLIGAFLAIFALIGLLVSAHQRSAAGALMVALLLWSLLVVVIPRSTVLYASWLPEVPSYDEVDERGTADWLATRDEYLRLNPKKENAAISGHWSPQESLDLACRLWQVYDGEMERWWRDQIHQLRLARRLAWISPVTLLSESLEVVAGTGVASYERFVDAALQYRDELQQQVRALYPLDPVNAPGLDPEALHQLEVLKVDVSRLPVFAHGRGDLGRAVASLALPATLLVIVALVLFLATTLAAARYDVR